MVFINGLLNLGWSGVVSTTYVRSGIGSQGEERLIQLPPFRRCTGYQDAGQMIRRKGKHSEGRSGSQEHYIGSFCSSAPACQPRGIHGEATDSVLLQGSPSLRRQETQIRRVHHQKASVNEEGEVSDGLTRFQGKQKVRSSRRHQRGGMIPNFEMADDGAAALRHAVHLTDQNVFGSIQCRMGQNPGGEQHALPPDACNHRLPTE